MIIRFRHKGLERLLTRGDTSGVSAQHVRKLQQIPAFLNVSQEPADMDLPGFRLHPSYERLYTTLSRRISFLLRTPWRCIPRSAEGAPLDVSLNRVGLSSGAP